MTDSEDSTHKPVGILELASGATVAATTGLVGWAFFLQPKALLDQAKAMQQATSSGSLQRSALQIAGLPRLPSVTDSDACGKYRYALTKAMKDVRRSVGIATIDKIELGVIAVGAGLATGYLINKWRNSGDPGPQPEMPSSEQSQAYRQLNADINRKETRGHGAHQRLR